MRPDATGGELADLASAFVMERRPGTLVYDVLLDGQWAVAHRPHGGYLLAMMVRSAAHALRDETGHAHPLAASAQFVSAPEIASATVEVEIVRLGRLASQVRVRLAQGSATCVDALITLGRLDAAAAVRWSDTRPPELPPIDECIRLPIPGSRMQVPVWHAVDLRLDPAIAGWTNRQPSGGGESRGWLRFAESQELDPAALLVALDILPAVTLELGSRGWVPTLELTAHIRALPAAGPLIVSQHARLVMDGFVDQTCDVWDSRGLLVAHASQLAAVRFRDETS